MTEESQALVPLHEKQIDFYGDQVVAVLLEIDGREEVYVPIRPISEYLGLSPAGQRERILRDPVMSKALRYVRVTRSNLGGRPAMLALPLKYLPGWLFGVNATRVKEDLREKVIRYQEECFDVLWRAFQADALARAQPQAPTSLTHIRSMGLAIAQSYKLIRQEQYQAVVAFLQEWRQAAV